MAETQTHFPPTETPPLSDALSIDKVHAHGQRELLSPDRLEQWRTRFGTMTHYLERMNTYNTSVLTSKGLSDTEVVRERVDFINHVDVTLLNFLHEISSHAEHVTQDEALEKISELLPLTTPSPGQQLIQDIVSRDHTLIRLERYCAEHGIPFEFASSQADVVNGYDVRIDGLPIAFMRPRTHGIYSNVKTRVGLASKQGGFDEMVSDGYYEFMQRVAAKQRKSRNTSQPTPKKAPKTIATKPIAAKTTNVTVEPANDNALNTLRIKPVIASKAVGLSFAETEPPYEYEADALDTTPESLALQIIEDALDDDETIDFYKIDTAEFGWRVKESIMHHHDDPLIVALKEFTVQSCGVGSKVLPHELATMLVDGANGRISQAGLRDALTYLYDISHKTDATRSNFISSIISDINGRSVEVSTHRLLSAMGYEVTEATREQDNRGVDLFVNGIPFDVKSSEQHALKAASNEVVRSQDTSANYIPSVRLVPPFTRESFKGQVVVPQEVISQLATDSDLHQRVDAAIKDYRARFGRRVDFS